MVDVMVDAELRIELYSRYYSRYRAPCRASDKVLVAREINYRALTLSQNYYILVDLGKYSTMQTQVNTKRIKIKALHKALHRALLKAL